MPAAPVCAPGNFILQRRASLRYEIKCQCRGAYDSILFAQCALRIIDMQRDFRSRAASVIMLGHDVPNPPATIETNRKLLAAWRAAGLQVVMHTREGIVRL